MIFHSRQYAEIDTALRAGKHLSRHDYLSYEFVAQNFDELERHYGSYGNRLIQHPDGFFFLAGKGLIPTRLLERSVMHLGKFIALKTRDPELTRSNGRIGMQELLHDVEASTPPQILTKVYSRNRKEVLTGAAAYEEIARALRVLNELGFVEIIAGDVVPREAIHRFAEVARHDNTPSDLARIALEVQRGVLFDMEVQNGENRDEGSDP